MQQVADAEKRALKSPTKRYMYLTHSSSDNINTLVNNTTTCLRFIYVYVSIFSGLPSPLLLRTETMTHYHVDQRPNSLLTLHLTKECPTWIPIWVENSSKVTQFRMDNLGKIYTSMYNLYTTRLTIITN
jgi:hypothetical protein